MTSSKLMKTNHIKLYVRPNSSDNRVEGIYKDRIKIRINATPEKGKANKESSKPKVEGNRSILKSPSTTLKPMSPLLYHRSLQ